jgi:hypothetical protein
MGFGGAGRHHAASSEPTCQTAAYAFIQPSQPACANVQDGVRVIVCLSKCRALFVTKAGIFLRLASVNEVHEKGKNFINIHISDFVVNFCDDIRAPRIRRPQMCVCRPPTRAAREASKLAEA